MSMREASDWVDDEGARVAFMTRVEFAALIQAIQLDAGASMRGQAAQRVRYYLKHQNLPPWDSMSETHKGISTACANLHDIIRALPSMPK